MAKLTDLECRVLNECLISMQQRRRVRYQGSRYYSYERLSNKQKKRVLELLERRLLTEGD